MCRHLRSLRALADLPALDLVLAGGEEVDELDGPEPRRDDLGQRGHRLVLRQAARTCMPQQGPVTCQLHEDSMRARAFIRRGPPFPEVCILSSPAHLIPAHPIPTPTPAHPSRMCPSHSQTRKEIVSMMTGTWQERAQTSFRYAAFSSSGMSNSFDSSAPLKGMMGSPPCSFTHSKICAANLASLIAYRTG